MRFQELIPRLIVRFRWPGQIRLTDIIQVCRIAAAGRTLTTNIRKIYILSKLPPLPHLRFQPCDVHTYLATDNGSNRTRVLYLKFIGRVWLCWVNKYNLKCDATWTNWQASNQLVRTVQRYRFPKKKIIQFFWVSGKPAMIGGKFLQSW